jgi:hypothetical protein
MPVRHSGYAQPTELYTVAVLSHSFYRLVLLSLAGMYYRTQKHTDPMCQVKVQIVLITMQECSFTSKNYCQHTEYQNRICLIVSDFLFMTFIRHTVEKLGTKSLLAETTPDTTVYVCMCIDYQK